MKPLYTLLFLGIYFFTRLHAQCGADVHITADGVGGYTFEAVNAADTSSLTQYRWRINGSPIDSFTLQTHFAFDTNGIYQVCINITDTATGCVYDSCYPLTVNDAEYHPLLDSVNIWHEISNFCIKDAYPDNGSRSGDCYYGSVFWYPSPVYYTNGDTIIDTISYKLLFAGWQPSQNCFYGFIREDVSDRKVYFLDNLGNPEVLLYDFSMNVGDTIHLDFTSFYNQYFLDGHYRLDSILTQTFNSGSKRIFYLNCVDSLSNTLTWIEGIGNLGDPVYLYSANNYGCGGFWGCGHWANNYFPYSFISTVVCFEHSQNVYFDSCIWSQVVNNQCFAKQDSCDYYSICGGISELSSLSSFIISPNPASDKAVVDLEVRQSDNFALMVQNTEGKNVIAESNLGWLQTGRHNVALDVSRLSSGIYFAGCKTTEGTLYRKLVVQR